MDTSRSCGGSGSSGAAAVAAPPPSSAGVGVAAQTCTAGCRVLEHIRGLGLRVRLPPVPAHLNLRQIRRPTLLVKAVARSPPPWNISRHHSHLSQDQ